jgi:transaldolase/glucose-6-phosphate isomerase
MASVIDQLFTLGQSLWYDNIERRLLDNGELAKLINQGDIRGLTSNPSIFHNAIAKSKDYDAALVPLAWSGLSAERIIEYLAIEDIRSAADLLLPIYQDSRMNDGYVSLEVNPMFARDTSRTLYEVRRLWEEVNRPNLMIKVPATEEGLPVIRQSISEGININVTLIFSLARYRAVMNAYLSGLEDRVLSGLPIDGINSVASFFVSRVDSKVDRFLENIIRSEAEYASIAKSLLGRIAIANSRMAYQEFLKVFGSQRFEQLQKHRAQIQRPLWASTSTKNPKYPDTLYVNELIGRNTVNTVPPQTLVAFKDHGIAELTIENSLVDAAQDIRNLGEIGISFDQVTRELETEGVDAFLTAYQSLIETIESRRLLAIRELGSLYKPVSERIVKLRENNVVKRLFNNDPTLWTDDPTGQAEIRMRLGWLQSPKNSQTMIEEVNVFASEVIQSGFTHVLLLGMGGSSLAPEVMSLVFAGHVRGLQFSILDSTDPGQVKAVASRSPVAKTLYIVASKSGGTAEVNAFLDYFWSRAQKAIGNKTNQHFVAITDPNTSLHQLAIERNFRKVFLADSLVGGRYSALTAFGIVPAGLIGIDLEKFLKNADNFALQCEENIPIERNLGLVLGTVIAEAAKNGRDKLTIIADKPMTTFGTWLEQLVAESSGKQGLGIVPVEGEPLAAPKDYGSDRFFVYLRNDGRFDQKCTQLLESGHPVLTFNVPNPYQLAGEFYRWEFATAVACMILGVNAFDQPDVQDAKTRTKNNIAIFRKNGKFDEGEPGWEGEGIQVYDDLPVGISGLKDALETFILQSQTGDYFAVNAYLPRNLRSESSLRKLRVAIRNKTKLATTIGFGPRFLHSTGQLHKGGNNNGLFLQITSNPIRDIKIPGQGLTFGMLERGQALGDLEALRARGRRVLRVHLSRPDLLNLLIDAVSS